MLFLWVLLSSLASCTALKATIITKLFDSAFKERAISFIQGEHEWPGMNKTQIVLLFPSALYLSNCSCYLVSVRLWELPEGHSHTFITRFSRDWEEMTEPYKVGSFEVPGLIPIVKLYEPFVPFQGPEDSRLFLNERGEICVTFNILANPRVRTQAQFNLHTLGINIYRLFPLLPDSKEKNWGPIIINKKLYFVWELNENSPPILLDCTLNINCKFVNNAEGKREITSTLKCASAIVEYEPGYFVGVAWRNLNRFYRPKIFILHVKDNDPATVKMIYLSRNIQTPFERYKIVIGTSLILSKSIDLNEEFMNPTLNVLEDRLLYDDALLTLYINDKKSYLMKLKNGHKRIRNEIRKHKETKIE